MVIPIQKLGPDSLLIGLPDGFPEIVSAITFHGLNGAGLFDRLRGPTPIWKNAFGKAWLNVSEHFLIHFRVKRENGKEERVVCFVPPGSEVKAQVGITDLDRGKMNKFARNWLRTH